MGKLHKQAKELLHAATKVYHYRRDVIAEGRLEELDKAVGEVDVLSKKGADDLKALEAAMDRLDALLHKVGGKMYPKTIWNDNLEVGLVAAILVIGVRTFFFQPFIIPTNSMYPTYSGMNAVVYEHDDESPSASQKVINKLTLGASHFRLDSPKSGNVRIPVFSQALDKDQGVNQMGVARFKIVEGRKWFGVLPAKKREYVFYVDDEALTLRVPMEFNLDDMIKDVFFPEAQSLGQLRYDLHQANALNAFSANPIITTNTTLDAGDPVIEFDITLGDALFVDRLSYHFVRPGPGDSFVFRTRDIPGIEGGSSNYVDKYYIKRIGGAGGETLEIIDGTLYADGEPRDEVEAFERNSRRDDEYNGYINNNLLGVGLKLEVPEYNYVALGDNSGNSLDSRYWGFVPDKAVIGKAIFIYYPFTKRWGVAE